MKNLVYGKRFLTFIALFVFYFCSSSVWSLDEYMGYPSIEQCSVVPAYSIGPDEVIDHRKYYGRLKTPFRVQARSINTEDKLLLSASEYYRTVKVPSHSLQGSFEKARAYADLAISGEKAYQDLLSKNMSRENWMQYGPLIDKLEATLSLYYQDPLDEKALDESLRFAVNRAYDSAWGIRGPVEHREKHRKNLGWIAVSGEDDRPGRPVNVLSAPYVQRDLEVQVGVHRIRTRVVFINPSIRDVGEQDMSFLPNEKTLPIILGDVLLFLHGNGSRAEEALDIAEPLIAKAKVKGRDLTIISMDLPGYAYSNTIDASHLGTMPLNTHPFNFSGLDLSEEFVVEFVRKLESIQPGIQHQIIGVMGGSLGGNLSLRLSRKDQSLYPWLGNNIAWSAASIWPSFSNVCEQPIEDYESCDPIDAIDFPLAFLGNDSSKKKAAIWGTTKNATEDSIPATREYFFSADKLRVPAYFTYADRWYGNNWPCKSIATENTKYYLGEIYGDDYLKWHWRISHEQLLYSHWDYISNPYTLGINSRMLLAAGEMDNHSPEYIYDNSEKILTFMKDVEGELWLIGDVGHSIHNEVPEYFGEKILGFIEDVRRAPVPAFLITSSLISL